MKGDKKITLGLVDDHTLFRRGIASLLREFDELDVLFEAANGIELQAQLKAHEKQVDIILMDISMPKMNGYESTAWIKDNFPHTKVLALSMFEDEKAIINMLKAGAVGYMLKESRPSDLLMAMNTIMEKGFYINELVTGRLLSSLQHDKQTQQTSLKITERELEFLQYCSTELTYKEIAAAMNVSPRTVDNYRESLFAKLNIKSRTGLVVYGIKNDLIKL
ncbi:response regulator transcription factor [Olivibacter sitiensis]|uniref:response regulator transcription factor n=1 Tax=Olivibacter sitiensis TaxID=376470 RepID=UPI0003FDB6F9|nr:response regulator transcription factor [Olivibacter sitiensis]